MTLKTGVMMLKIQLCFTGKKFKTFEWQCILSLHINEYSLFSNSDNSIFSTCKDVNQL